MKSKTWTSFLFYLTAVFSPLSMASNSAVFEGQSFTFQRIGRDAEGIPFDTRFQVMPKNGKVLKEGFLTSWETASRGGFCPNEAGRFRGTLTAEEMQSLLEKGLKEIKSQNAMKLENQGGTPTSQPTTTSSLTLWSEGKDYYAEIKHWDKGLLELDGMMALIKGKMNPFSAIKVEAEQKNGQIILTFTHQGQEPFLLTLPEKASMGFRFEESDEDAQYAKNPTSLHYTLGPKQKQISIALKLPKKKSTAVKYSNHMARHHANSKETPPIVDICAPLASR